MARNTVAKDLRTPKYRARVAKDKRKAKSKRKCRKSSGITIEDYIGWGIK